MSQNGQGKAKAVITVYLALTLLLALGLICTVAESARVRVLNFRASGVAYMAADSAFAAFARPVFEDYGIMMIFESGSELKEDIEDFIKGNTENNGAEGIVFADLYGLELNESSISEIQHPTDDAGEPFARQAEEYMEYYLAKDMLDRLMENNSIFSQGDKVDKFMEKIEEHEKTFTRVEESVEDIKEKIDRARAKGKDPEKSLQEMADALESYAENGDAESERKFGKAKRELRSTRDQLSSLMDSIEKKTEKYYDNVDRAKEAVGEIEGEFLKDAGSFDPEIYELISEQMNELKEKSADTEADFYDVGANSSAVSEINSKLDSLDGLFESTDGALSEENAEEYRRQVNYYKNMFYGFSLDGLGVNYDASSVAKEDKGFLKNASKILKGGLLKFIAGDVSEKAVKTKDFPSGSLTKAQKKEDGGDLISAAKEKLLFSEYILTHFSNAVEKLPETALEYEAEYIIAGKKADKDNLSAVVADIVALRTGCNLISLLKDSGKKAETYALATSLVGFTGMPVVIKIMQLIVMAAWALAESIADVKALLEGGKVETIKDGDDWYISLWALKNFGKEKLSGGPGDRGLGYEDYLRLILLTQAETVQHFRTMDMIQADICKRENEDFRVSECITGVKTAASFSAPMLFAAFPFVAGVSGAGGGDYGFEISIYYTYQ